MRYRGIISAFFLISAIFSAKAYPLYIDSCSSIQDDPIVYMLDSLSNLKYFEKGTAFPNFQRTNKYNFSIDSVPVYTDSIYEARLKKIDTQSPFDLQYNCAVRGYIDLYAVRKRELVSKVIGLSHIYFPMFEEVLDKYDLPLEFKYLAVIESALNTKAKSRSGAMGLWQFMYHTGKLYNLKVTSYFDDRCDPYRSTVAACEYFKFLYGLFGDWQMVLAAYNGGPGSVNKAIKRSGGKRTYWEIRPFLPRETQGYVPAFIAVNYVMSYLEEHNLYSSLPKKTFFQFDTVGVKQQVAFGQISTLLNIPIEEIQFLNPQYKKDVIPAPYSEKEVFTLCLPSDKIGTFIANEGSIYNYLKTDSSVARANLASQEILKIHTVRKGERIGDIAKRYNCSVTEIKSWNNLKSTSIRKGQQLNIYVQINAFLKKDTVVLRTTDTSQVIKTTASEKTKTFLEGKYKYYTIQQGDTLWDIAKAYGITVEDIKRLNNFGNGEVLKPGKKIKIGTAG